MHPVMVLVAFAIAALVTYALVVAALSATSELLHEDRDDASGERHHPGGSPPPRSELVAGPPLPPWVRVSRNRTLHLGDTTDAPATDRRSHVHC